MGIVEDHWYPTLYRIMEDTMNCPRCNGLAVVDYLTDYFHTVLAYRCVNCGAIIEPGQVYSLKTREVATVKPGRRTG